MILVECVTHETMVFVLESRANIRSSVSKCAVDNLLDMEAIVVILSCQSLLDCYNHSTVEDQNWMFPKEQHQMTRRRFQL